MPRIPPRYECSWADREKRIIRVIRRGRLLRWRMEESHILWDGYFFKRDSTGAMKSCPGFFFVDDHGNDIGEEPLDQMRCPQNVPNLRRCLESLVLSEATTARPLWKPVTSPTRAWALPNPARCLGVACSNAGDHVVGCPMGW